MHCEPTIRQLHKPDIEKGNGARWKALGKAGSFKEGAAWRRYGVYVDLFAITEAAGALKLPDP